MLRDQNPKPLQKSETKINNKNPEAVRWIRANPRRHFDLATGVFWRSSEKDFVPRRWLIFHR